MSGTECCSGICTNNMCGQPSACQPEASACTTSTDCCAGLFCDIPPGMTSGTCHKAVEANPKLYFSEQAATRSFYLWGKLLRAVGEPGHWGRKPVLLVYVIFLITLIVTVVPISLAVQTLIRPLLWGRFARMKQNFELPSGCGAERHRLRYRQS